MVPENMWRQTDSPVYNQLTNYSQYETWNDVALLPHQWKCGHNYVNIPSLSCNCGSDSDKDRACLVQKLEFTASLLAIRLFCSNLDYYGDKYTRETFVLKPEFNIFTLPEDRNPYLVEYKDMNTISMLTMGWIGKCRELAFVTAKDSNLKTQFELLDYCLTIIQQCQDFTVAWPTQNTDGTASMRSECEMTEQKYEEIYKNFDKAAKLGYWKLATKIGAGIVSVGVLVVTSVGTGGLAVPVIGTLVATGALGGGLAIDGQINRLKDNGKTIEFGADDAISLGGIGLSLIGLGIATHAFELAPQVYNVFTVSKEAKNFHGIYKLHKNLEKATTVLKDFPIDRIIHDFTHYKSIMTKRLFYVMNNTINVLNNEPGTNKLFLRYISYEDKVFDEERIERVKHAISKLEAELNEKEKNKIKELYYEEKRNGEKHNISKKFQK